MKSIHEHRAEQKDAAARMEDWNNRACIHFAEMLRAHDKYLRLCKETGKKPEADLIPLAYFEAVYKILSFAPEASRAILMLGSADDIEKLVSRVQTEKGFYTSENHWIEL